MSGGGGKPRGGRICLGSAAPRSVDTKAAGKELERAEAELAQQEGRLRQLRELSDQARAALKQAEAQLAQQERELPRAQMELEANKHKARDLQQRLQELQAATQVGAFAERRLPNARPAAAARHALVTLAGCRCMALAAAALLLPARPAPRVRLPLPQSTGEEAGRVAELEQSIKAGERELAELNKGAAALQQQAGSLQQQVDNAGGEKLRKHKALVAKLAKALEELDTGATKKDAQAKSSQKQLDKLRKEIGGQGGWLGGGLLPAALPCRAATCRGRAGAAAVAGAGRVTAPARRLAEAEVEKTQCGIKGANEDITALEQQALTVMELVESTKVEQVGGPGLCEGLRRRHAPPPWRGCRRWCRSRRAGSRRPRPLAPHTHTLQAECEAVLAEVCGEKARKQAEVGIIRNVELELEARAEKLKALRGEEAAKVKMAEKEVAALVAKLKDYTGGREGRGGPARELAGPALSLLASRPVCPWRHPAAASAAASCSSTSSSASSPG
jgi:hypothetical protein